MRKRLCTVCFLCLPLSLSAFYQNEFEEGYLETRGLIQLLGLAANNPNDPLLFDDDKILGGALSARLILDAAWRDWQLELHAVQDYQQSELLTAGQRVYLQHSVERSDALDWHFSNRHASFSFDRLNMQYGKGNLNIKVGRQPINLATSYYFTPNDFFAPFAAQTFYRTYKPGVDAIRADWQWPDFTQLTLVSVLEYPSDSRKETGWGSGPDWSQTAYLGRMSRLFGSTEWGLIVAEINNDTILGFDFQGELFGTLGIRGEGHSRFYDEDERDRDTKISLSFEYRPNARSSLRLEQYYQRSGVNDQRDYSLTAIDSSSYYQARHYTALGATYEFTPLFNLDFLTIYNPVDHGVLIALYGTYSLSNETELALGLNLPIASEPRQAQLQTEFGALPDTFTVEIRSYF